MLTLLPLCAAALHSQLLNKLSDQLLHKPLPASAGSVHSLLLQLVPTANVAAPVAAGRLKLMWRRRQPAAVAAHGGATSSSAGATAAAADGLAVCAAPSADVETCLDLPQVLVQDSLLSIRASAPQHVTAGLPFAFTMQVSVCESPASACLHAVTLRALPGCLWQYLTDLLLRCCRPRCTT
jgi:hypothetical protein